MMGLFAASAEIPYWFAAPFGAIALSLYLLGWVWEKFLKPKGD